MKGLTKPNKLSHDTHLPFGGKPVMCVYRLTFDCGGFYIGSTTDYRKRIVAYRTQFNTGAFTVANLIIAFEKSETAKIKIIELVWDVDLLFDIELKHIQAVYKDKNCLNKALDTRTNFGSRWSPEQRAGLSKVMLVSAKRRWEVIR